MVCFAGIGFHLGNIGYNVQKVLSIPKAAQVELDSPAVSTLSLVNKMEG